MRGHIGAAALGLICALSLTGCSDAGLTSDAAAAPKRTGRRQSGLRLPQHPGPRPPRPQPPPSAIWPTPPSTSPTAGDVGVGMPISVTFKRPIPTSERADVERRLKVTADPGVTGAWAWIKDRNLHDGQRVDFRPAPTGSRAPRSA